MAPYAMTSISFLILLMVSASLSAQTALLTRSYDDGRTGANTSERTLTPQLLESKGLRRFKSLTVNDDPRIEAQPLYIPHLQMPRRDTSQRCLPCNYGEPCLGV